MKRADRVAGLKIAEHRHAKCRLPGQAAGNQWNRLQLPGRGDERTGYRPIFWADLWVWVAARTAKAGGKYAKRQTSWR